MRSTFAFPLSPGLVRWLLIVALSCLALPAAAQSMRFFGTGNNDVDRVKIARSGGQPADIGATDFTIEMWLRPAPALSGNSAGSVATGPGQYSWIAGNTFFDGDVYNRNPGFGASLTAGVVTFGVKNASGAEETWRSSTDIRDDRWHHVAITRVASTGAVQIYIDGVREVNDPNGPVGDLSYPGGAPLSLCGRTGNQSCSFSDPFLVLGAEKHDAGTAYPSYVGYMTELRLSSSIRYSGATLVVPTQPFTAGTNPLALYHFEEGAGAILFDTAANAGGTSNGEVRFNAGATRPVWSSDSPFGSTSPGSLQWVSSSASVSEGAGSIALSVSRVGGDTGAVSINYATANGSASAGSDYTGASGTLNWADGDTAAKTLTIPILNDSTFEPVETFSVLLSGAVGGATVGTPATVTVTINDNDPAPPAGSLQFSVAATSVTEGSGSIAVTVTRVGGSSGAVSVNYATANGSASAGSDYTGASGTLNWADGDTAAKTLTIPILNDSTFEPVETFSVLLSGAVGGATVGSPATVTVTINDNDPPPPAGSLQFSVAAASVSEGSGSITVTVTRVGGSSGVVSVNYATANGSASAGSDYTNTSGALRWTNGDPAPQTISIPIIDDSAFEAAETFTVVLSNVTGGASVGSPASMTITVTDNDTAPVGGGGSSSGGGGGSLDLLTLAILVLAIVGARRSVGGSLSGGPVMACTVTRLRANAARATLPSRNALSCPLDFSRNCHRGAISLDSHPFP